MRGEWVWSYPDPGGDGTDAAGSDSAGHGDDRELDGGHGGGEGDGSFTLALHDEVRFRVRGVNWTSVRENDAVKRVLVCLRDAFQVMISRWLDSSRVISRPVSNCYLEFYMLEENTRVFERDFSFLLFSFFCPFFSFLCVVAKLQRIRRCALFPLVVLAISLLRSTLERKNAVKRQRHSRKGDVPQANERRNMTSCMREACHDTKHEIARKYPLILEYRYVALYRTVGAIIIIIARERSSDVIALYCCRAYFGSTAIFSSGWNDANWAPAGHHSLHCKGRRSGWRGQFCCGTRGE